MFKCSLTSVVQALLNNLNLQIRNARYVAQKWLKEQLRKVLMQAVSFGDAQNSLSAEEQLDHQSLESHSIHNKIRG